MKLVYATIAALSLFGSIALAQGSTGGSAGGSPGTSAAPGSSGTPSTIPGTAGQGPGSNNATVPLGTTLPGGTPSPSDSSTVGRGSGVNPANPQDMIGRSNPQDLTSPRGRNPSDTGSGNTGNPPPIMVPER